LYQPDQYHTSPDGTQSAPGVAAGSFTHQITTSSHESTSVSRVFIHGPSLDQVSYRGWYAADNRQGAVVHWSYEMTSNKQTVVNTAAAKLEWVDWRTTLIDPVTNSTPRGAHRGGTHRHQYTMSGSGRIGCT
jgi:hypothetical protein